MNAIDTLKRMRIITITIGVLVMLGCIGVAHLAAKAGQRDRDAGNAIITRMQQDELLRTQVVKLNDTVHKRARLLVPYCRVSAVDPLFRHALIIAPGLNANLTGASALTPDQARQQQVQAQQATPPPQQSLVQNVENAVTGKTSATPSPTPAPQLAIRTQGENVNGPFLLVMRALEDLQHDPAILSAAISTIQQAKSDDKTGANTVQFTLTLAQATIPANVCHQINMDAAFVPRRNAAPQTPVLPSAPQHATTQTPAFAPQQVAPHRIHLHMHHFTTAQPIHSVVTTPKTQANGTQPLIPVLPTAHARRAPTPKPSGGPK